MIRMVALAALFLPAVLAYKAIALLIASAFFLVQYHRRRSTERTAARIGERRTPWRPFRNMPEPWPPSRFSSGAKLAP